MNGIMTLQWLLNEMQLFFNSYTVKLVYYHHLIVYSRLHINYNPWRVMQVYCHLIAAPSVNFVFMCLENTHAHTLQSYFFPI